ncbi:hypothetical protein [Pengzhenrongella phosphoraccumulans]|uniref:hypothetical protein n=1 Tax=Pengzhenrongella phosphoraccumulans TaxID=3114394 RepID=UPI00388DCEC7
MSRPRSTSVRKSLRLGGFLGAVGLTAVLAGVAVSGTGAYFSDTEVGGLSATAGHVNLSVSNPNIAFTGLMPGVDPAAQSINYSLDVSGKSDVWLTFEPTSVNYLAFTGANRNPLYPDGGLGRYGHFKVGTAEAGVLFESYNLNHVPANEPNSVPCPVTADGTGGANRPATPEYTHPAYCGVPSAIKLASGLSNGAHGTIQVTFGLTTMADELQDIQWANVPFKIVATQEGVRPNAVDDF